MTTTRQQGFTLVELAIAIVVIGLLIGGVLKGNEILENARVTGVVKQINEIDYAVATFRSIYNNELPGDIKDPGSRIPNCSAPCDKTSAITGDRVIGGQMNSEDIITERENFWRHLDRTGLLDGIDENRPLVGASRYERISPENPFKGFYAIHHGVTGNHVATGKPHLFDTYNTRLYIGDLGSRIIMYANRAAIIDKKIDDGKPFTGRAMLARQAYSFHSNVSCYDSTSFEYNPSYSHLGCYFGIVLQSLN